MRYFFALRPCLIGFVWGGAYILCGACWYGCSELLRKTRRESCRSSTLTVLEVPQDGTGTRAGTSPVTHYGTFAPYGIPSALTFVGVCMISKTLTSSATRPAPPAAPREFIARGCANQRAVVVVVVAVSLVHSLCPPSLLSCPVPLPVLLPPFLFLSCPPSSPSSCPPSSSSLLMVPRRSPSSCRPVRGA